MNEDFVPFELAVKLKKKGFNKETVHRYNDKGEICVPLVGEEYPYLCPTISQVLRWLREEKAISVEPCATPYNCWYYMIKCKGEIKATYMDNKYKTYEGAVIAGIEYVLDNLI